MSSTLLPPLYGRGNIGENRHLHCLCTKQAYMLFSCRDEVGSYPALSGEETPPSRLRLHAWHAPKNERTVAIVHAHRVAVRKLAGKQPLCQRVQYLALHCAAQRARP